MSYQSVTKEGSAVVEIEKSRFIGRAKHVTSEVEAAALLAEIRQLEPDATHHCFGYIADKWGNVLRFSDDKEPSGTAGMPILEVIRQRKLFETMVVVTRYFGGIKLGAGGLARAYAKTCCLSLDASEIGEFVLHKRLQFELEYSLYNLFDKQFSMFSLMNRQIAFDERVSVKVSVPVEELDRFKAALCQFTWGKVELNLVGECYLPVV